MNVVEGVGLRPKLFRWDGAALPRLPKQPECLIGQSATASANFVKGELWGQGVNENRERVAKHWKKNNRISCTLWKQLIEPSERGDPQSPLRWTCKSLTNLATELKQQGYQVGRTKVAGMLHQLGYSLQANRKTREGKEHPDRDAQFEYINRRVQAYRRGGRPAVSVDTKKKENIGNKANGGREYRPKGSPKEVDTHDFSDKKKGKAIPYGVYDIKNNEAWVSVGITCDTAEFAVEAIRLWWRQLGRKRFRKPSRLLVTADGGGSNGHRNRLWKLELQRLANQTGMIIEVCHYPPGTSKWNKIGYNTEKGVCSATSHATGVVFP